MRAKLYAQLAGFLQEKCSIGGNITQHGIQNFEDQMENPDNYAVGHTISSAKLRE